MQKGIIGLLLSEFTSGSKKRVESLGDVFQMWNSLFFVQGLGRSSELWTGVLLHATRPCMILASRKYCMATGKHQDYTIPSEVVRVRV